MICNERLNKLGQFMRLREEKIASTKKKKKAFAKKKEIKKKKILMVMDKQAMECLFFFSQRVTNVREILVLLFLLCRRETDWDDLKLFTQMIFSCSSKIRERCKAYVATSDKRSLYLFLSLIGQEGQCSVIGTYQTLYKHGDLK